MTLENYENARPAMPIYPVNVIKLYLGRNPETVVDLGCGTRFSTLIWKGNCKRAIDVEPNGDMLAIALRKQDDNTKFLLSHENWNEISKLCIL